LALIVKVTSQKLLRLSSSKLTIFPLVESTPIAGVYDILLPKQSNVAKGLDMSYKIGVSLNNELDWQLT
jgi:hypothetical protein